MFNKAADGTKHISEHVENDAQMKEEGKLSLRHSKDFRYFIYEGETKQKDLVEKTKYVLMYDHKDRQVKFQRVASDIILHKVKPTGPKKKELEHEKLVITGRKPYISEAARKRKLLSKMGVRLCDAEKSRREVRHLGSDPRPGQVGPGVSGKAGAKKEAEQQPGHPTPARGRLRLLGQRQRGRRRRRGGGRRGGGR